jgi:hypothetical protein
MLRKWSQLNVEQTLEANTDETKYIKWHKTKLGNKIIQATTRNSSLRNLSMWKQQTEISVEGNEKNKQWKCLQSFG